MTTNPRSALWIPLFDELADPLVAARLAAATDSLRLGPMVTPVARYRPATLARQTASLDRLSGGRLTLGVGLGGDAYGAEFARTGEQVDGRVPAEMLDETLDILRPDPTAPFDIAMPLPPGVDPTAYVGAGATWCLTELEPDAMTLDHVRGVLWDGPTIPDPTEVTST